MTAGYLYMAQRLSAIIMIPLVLGHLILIIYAVQGGLSAEEILGRTQGSVFWALYYGLFVLAASVHAAIGVRSILGEWLGLSRPALNVTAIGFAILLIILGGRAVVAVVA